MGASLRISLWVERLATAMVAAMASLGTTSSIATDLDSVSPSMCRSVRKEAFDDAQRPDDDGPIATFATIVNTHSDEIVVLDESEPSASRFDAMVSDRTTGAQVAMDPNILGLLRSLTRTRSAARVEIVSGYRSAKLNEVLRKKGHNVASHSQHSLGHALDFRIVGLGPIELRKEIESLRWIGGIGTYESPTDRFVHADVGPDRRWKGK
jgi:uncharacterized protein YcbK (DUF882 family)